MSHILTLNTGSSSAKFKLFDWTEGLPLLAGGKITDIGGAPEFSAYTTPETGREISETHTLSPHFTHKDAQETILTWLSDQGFTLQAAAHRIVHGGERYAAPARLDQEAMTYLHALEPLAPLHQPHNLAAVDNLQKHHPELTQYGCFDTAFHARHTPLFHEFPLPEHIREKGIKRYGFHGLSYDWVAHSLRADHPALATGKVVVAHLGNGASLCALQNGQSIDTTMSMTALDGLPMGTRSGALDPGAIIYMMRTLELSLDETENILYNQSGLKGLSGLTNDVQALSDSSDEKAAFALEYFTLKCAQYIAAMSVSIGGLDGLIFTGGIGENAPNVRAMILARLSHLPPFEHHVIPADEERAMALEIWENFGPNAA